MILGRGGLVSGLWLQFTPFNSLCFRNAASWLMAQSWPSGLPRSLTRFPSNTKFRRNCTWPVQGANSNAISAEIPRHPDAVSLRMKGTGYRFIIRLVYFFQSPASRLPLATSLSPFSTPVPTFAMPSPSGFATPPVTPLTVSPRPRVRPPEEGLDG